MIKRFIAIIILIGFFLTSVVRPNFSYAQELVLPRPGVMIDLSPAYVPLLIKGLKVHPDNPLLFDFILDTGETGLKVNSPEFKIESEKLIKYFLASLTIKEDDLWVNLSPYEKDRMIPKGLGKTELGRDMLAQDYILKQLTASMIYPEKHLGKEFWSRVYTKAQQIYGTSLVPVNTFNKVWIVADKAKVLERNNAAYVIGSHLKVMLEEDYIALSKHQMPTRGHVPEGDVSPSTLPNESVLNVKASQGNHQPTNAIASQVVRQIIIPELEKEVNQGKNFAPLRQMFYSMILASWYKLAIKNALLNEVYSDKAKTNGVLSDDPAAKEKIYQQYLKAYKKGVFNYIKEDIDAVSKEPFSRKYFSGGEVFSSVLRKLDRAQKVTMQERAAMLGGDLAMVTTNIAEAPSTVASARIRAALIASLWDPNIKSDDKRLGLEPYPEMPKFNKISNSLARALAAVQYMGEWKTWFSTNLPQVTQTHEYIGDGIDPFSTNLLDHFLKHEYFKVADLLGYLDLYKRSGKQKYLDNIRDLLDKSEKDYQDATVQELFLNYLNEDNILRAQKYVPQYEGLIIKEQIEKVVLDKKAVLDKKYGSDWWVYVSDTLIKNGWADRKSDTEIIFTANVNQEYAQMFEKFGDNLLVILPVLQQKWQYAALFRYLIARAFFVPDEKKAGGLDKKGKDRANDFAKALRTLVGNFPEAMKAIGGLVNWTPKLIKEVSSKSKNIVPKSQISPIRKMNRMPKRIISSFVNPPGGIDLNAKNMELDLAKQGGGIRMTFNPAMIDEFRRGDFSGVVPVIISITPIQSPWALLGVDPADE